MSDHLVLVRQEDNLLYVSLNRPEKRNAFSHELVAALKAALTSAFENQHVKIIILKGEGEAFSAGADLASLKKLQTNTYEENLADSKHLMELFLMIYESPKVIVAQVEGHALAGGCGLATLCDFVFAVPEALFGYTEVKIGFIPAMVLVFLVRKLGEGKAKELLLTGDLISAERAREFGLINFVVEKEDIADRVNNFARQLAKSASGNSLRLTRQLIAQTQDLSYRDALELAANANAEARASSDCQSGIQAFLNKEKIQWS